VARDDPCAPTAASSGALARDAGEYTFTVLKDGSPVGQHRITFDREGGRVEIREATEIEVRFATIPIYRFEHEGREVWQNGRPVRIDATTDDNGEKFAIAVRRIRHGYTRMVNGRVENFDESKNVLAFWNKDVVNHRDFFSAIDDKTLKVRFEFLGREKIAVAGAKLDVEHYRMVGDEERDLWFDQAGRIAKVEFRRLGADIAYLRDQLAPLVPAGSCSKSC
jgi:hypothetical protein